MSFLKHIACLTVLTLVGAPAAFARCFYKDNGTAQTIDFGSSLANRSLLIPPGTPDNTVVYLETTRIAQRDWFCTESSRYGVVNNPALGTVNSGSIFPIGKTGLSYRIWMTAMSRYETAPKEKRYGNYTIPAGFARLEIIKSGPLATRVNVAAGILGSLKDDDMVVSDFNLTHELVLNTASCQTPSVAVAMGDDYKLWEFRDPNSTPRVIHFNIGLNQCQAGINKVIYSLTATTTIIDATKGIVALNAGSTAEGIGLQVLNDAGQPIALNTDYTFNGFNTSATNFQIPFSATYYRLPTANIKAGSANTEVTFTVQYL